MYVSSHLGAELEVAQQDGGLRNAHEEDDKDQEEEAEHEEELVTPDAV